MNYWCTQTHISEQWLSTTIQQHRNGGMATSSLPPHTVNPTSFNMTIPFLTLTFAYRYMASGHNTFGLVAGRLLVPKPCIRFQYKPYIQLSDPSAYATLCVHDSVPLILRSRVTLPLPYLTIRHSISYNGCSPFSPGQPTPPKASNSHATCV